MTPPRSSGSGAHSIGATSPTSAPPPCSSLMKLLVFHMRTDILLTICARALHRAEIPSVRFFDFSSAPGLVTDAPGYFLKAVPLIQLLLPTRRSIEHP
jgi:hypothetical protein